MNSENNTTQEAARTVRVPQRVPGFVPMKFAREVVNKAGEKVLTLDLKHKKAWFRLACPNGGVVLNPLRVTDQMAIFEARLFADTDDRNPLASFTATRSAEKTTGKQYVIAAQDAALNEALDNAGFCLPVIPMPDVGKQEAAAPATQTEAVPKAADSGRPTKAPPVAAPQQAAKPAMKAEKNVQAAQPAPKAAPPAPKFKPVTETAPRPAPVGPPPHGPGVLASSTGGAQTRGDAGSKPAGAPVVDISTAKSAEKAQPAAQQEQAGAAVQTAAESATAQDTSAPVNEGIAPVTYTADMTVEEIRQHMTLEQAKAIKVEGGTCKGWTLEQVAADRPSSLKWLRYTAPFADNVLKAAADILLNDLELKKAG